MFTLDLIQTASTRTVIPVVVVVTCSTLLKDEERDRSREDQFAFL